MSPLNPLNPQSPFVWPEPRVLEAMTTYQHQPPFGDLAQRAHSLFGIVTALSTRGVEVLRTWLETNPHLKARLLLVVYPTCSTRQADLSRLLDLVQSAPERLFVRIHPLGRVTDRATNTLCFLTPGTEAVRLVTGPTQDLGLEPPLNGQVNLVFRPDPALTEAFKRYFDWMWADSQDITAQGTTQIPDLVLPEGTEEAERMWLDYVNEFLTDTPRAVACVNPDTGDVTIQTEDGKKVTPPTEELGLPKLDQLAERIARLYDKGSLVSIDKLSRIPPLDAPLDPSAFGDSAEIHRGNVTRKVSMRVSIIDEKTLKEIEKRRQGLRTLLTRFTFGLADNMRWMPTAARELFESELKRVNEEGQKLISDLLKGDVDAFIEAKRSALIADIKDMYEGLGRPGQVTGDVITRVVGSLKLRLTRAESANFTPTLSYSVVSFARTHNSLVSPWGQAFSLLADVVSFPRKVLTDSFFFRGLKVPEDDLIEAMNVADDALCRNLHARGIKDRCRAELDLLTRIEEAEMESRERCELAWRILDGDPAEAIEESVGEKEVK